MSSVTVVRVERIANGIIRAYAPDGSSWDWPSIVVIRAKALRARKDSDRMLYAAMLDILALDPRLENSKDISVTMERPEIRKVVA